MLFGDSKYTKNDASLLPLKARFHPQGENGNRTISPKNKGGINIPPVQLPHLGLQKARHDPTNFRSEKELVRRALSEHPSAFMTRTGIRRVMTFESAYRDYRDWKDGNGYWRKHAKDMRADVYAKFQR